MEVKYKAPKAGKSLLAKVAPPAKARSLIFKSRGVPLAPREEGASKKPKALGSKARMALLRLEELEKEGQPFGQSKYIKQSVLLWQKDQFDCLVGYG